MGAVTANRKIGWKIKEVNDVNKFKIGTEKLSQIVEIISTLVDETRVKIGEEGWKIVCVDPAHVAMLDMQVDKNAFDKYCFEEPFEIGVDIDKLKGILKTCKDHGIETFEGELVESKRIDVAHDILVTAGSLKRLLVSDKAEGMSDPKVPNYAQQLVEREVKVSDLMFGIENAKLIFDHIAFIIDEGGLKMRSDGDMEYSDLLLNDKGHEEPQRSLFALDYLGGIVKATPIDNVNLRIGTDHPVDIVYEFDGVKVRFLLAPRIENE